MFCNDYDYCLGVIDSKARNVSFRKTKHMSATVSSNPTAIILQFMMKKSSVLFSGNLNLRQEFTAASASESLEKFEGDITLKAIGGRPGAICRFRGALSIAGQARTTPILTQGEVRAQAKAKSRMANLETASACFTLSNAIDREVRLLSKTVDKILNKQSQVTRANERLFPEHTATYTLPIARSSDVPAESPRRKKKKQVPVIPRCALPENNRKPEPIDHNKPMPVQQAPKRKRPSTTGKVSKPKRKPSETEEIEVIEEAETNDNEEKMKSEKEATMKSEKEATMKSEKEATMKSEKEATMKSEKEATMKSEKKESSSSSSSSSYEYVTEEYEVQPSPQNSDSESILSDSEEEKKPVKRTRRIKKRKANKPKKETQASESKPAETKETKASSSGEKPAKSAVISESAVAEGMPKKQKKEVKEKDSILSDSSSSSSMSFVSDSHNESRANSPSKQDTSNISGFVVNDSPILEKKPEPAEPKSKDKKNDSILSGVSDLSSTDIDESLLKEEEKKETKPEDDKKSKSDEKEKSDTKKSKNDSIEDISGLSGISGLSKGASKVGDKEIDDLLDEIESDSDKPKKSRANTIKLPSEGEGSDSIDVDSSSSGFF